MDEATKDMMKQLETEHVAMLQTIVDANEDLLERVRRLGVHAEYDREEDSISVMIGPRVEASTESVSNQIYFSVDPETMKIVAVDVFGVRDLITDPPEGMGAMAEAVAALAAGILVDADMSTGRVAEHLAVGIRELALA